MAPGAGLEPAVSTLTAWRCTNSTTPEYKQKTDHMTGQLMY